MRSMVRVFQDRIRIPYTWSCGAPMLEVQFTPSTRILHGLDEIGQYLRVSSRTAIRWIHSWSLPAMQTPAGTWITSTSLIDLWIITCHSLQRKQWATKPQPEDKDLSEPLS